MKKLFLLLILSFFSAQGFAAGCPDGSDPVKSVSADGTYFVYNCGGTSNNTSTSINSSSSASSGAIKKNFEVDKNSSHALQFKDVHVDIQSLRKMNGETVGYGASISYLDFDSDGDTDIFIAADAQTIGEGAKQQVEVYMNNGSYTFTIDRGFFGSNPPKAEVPRKSIIGDYNGDGKEDIYVAGHGWDQPPYGGEAPVLILSSKAGYTTSVLDNYVGFQHGAASADIDADGDLDIVGVITDTPTKSGANYVMMLINDGSGNFVHDKTKLQNLKGRYYTVELVDVDKDGYIDLLLGGLNTNTWKPITEILWGSGLGDYSNWNKTILPAVPGQLFAIDIDVGDIDNDGDKDIILNRTGSAQGLGDYIGYYVQILKNNGDRSFTQTGSIVNETIPFNRGIGKKGGWFMWIRLVDMNNDGNLDIIVDDAQTHLIWINSGSGSFSSLQDIEEDYKNGVKDGKLTLWYINGQIKSEKNYKNGTIDGKLTIWNENGQALLEENYKNGKKDGKLTSWYESGQIKSEKNYKNGKKDGKLTSWYKNGQMSSDGNYQNGKENGKDTMWYENGQKTLEVNYKNGKFDGKLTAWAKDGQILKNSIFKDGQCISGDC
jgi:antitoxin component YwqK of YwqJK toxin-antitoxin module